MISGTYSLCSNDREEQEYMGEIEFDLVLELEVIAQRDVQLGYALVHTDVPWK